MIILFKKNGVTHTNTSIHLTQMKKKKCEKKYKKPIEEEKKKTEKKNILLSNLLR